MSARRSHSRPNAARLELGCRAPTASVTPITLSADAMGFPMSSRHDEPSRYAPAKPAASTIFKALSKILVELAIAQASRIEAAAIS